MFSILRTRCFLRALQHDSIAHWNASAYSYNFKLYYSLARGPRNDRSPNIQGAFHGAILSTTPYGSLTTMALRSSSRIDGTEPCTVAISPAQLFSDSKASLKSNSKYGSASINQSISTVHETPTTLKTNPSTPSPCYKNATDHPSSWPTPPQLSRANPADDQASSYSKPERPSPPPQQPQERRPSKLRRIYIALHPSRVK